MILTALNRYYDRLIEQENTDIAPYGLSQEKISYALIINTDGQIVDVMNLMDTSGKKPRPSIRLVPKPPTRSVNIAPCFLWDKTSYVLGLTAGTSDKDLKRATQTHEAFKRYHEEWLGQDESKSEELSALLAFLKSWNPDNPIHRQFITDDMLDTNIVFRIDGQSQFLHESPSAKRIIALQTQKINSENQICLVTGESQPIAELHAKVKGVKGAQSSGASLVSFNQESFASYGKIQGQNAPVSEKAAFAYVTALNHLLRGSPDNHQRVRIGDTTVVFWAESDSLEQAEASEALFASIFSSAPPVSTQGNDHNADLEETRKLESAFAQIASGRPLDKLGTDLDPATRIYVLGLAPNAARLSIRFWETDTLARFSNRLTQHFRDLMLAPLPWTSAPSIWRLVNETVPHRKGAKPKQEDASPHLAGELVRSILTGQRYPYSLLANIIMRFRADGDISNLRVALCKAVLVRHRRLTHNAKRPLEGGEQIRMTKDHSSQEGDHYHNDEKELFVSLDVDNRDSGYLLGRLFAVLEWVQHASLGKNVNATIRDRYYGSASANPASVFPVLLRNAQNHLGKVRKTMPGLATNQEKLIGEIIDKLDSSFAKSLGLESQGRFAIGYYHQRNETFRKPETPNETLDSPHNVSEGAA